MTQMPAWMKNHIGTRGSFATVSVAKNIEKAQREAKASLNKKITAGELVMLYAMPIITSMQCGKVIGLLREQIIKSRIEEDNNEMPFFAVDELEKRSKMVSMATLIKKAQESIDDEMIRMRKIEDGETLSEWIIALSDKWFQSNGLELIETWRNAFSAMLLKRKVCGNNENLHEFCCYALATRAVAKEAVDCNSDVKKIIDKKLEGTGQKWDIYGESPIYKMMTAANAVCDRFRLPSYEETIQDMNVRRCSDNWRRRFGSLMLFIKTQYGEDN